MFDILEGTEMRVSNLMLMLSDEEAQLPVHGGEISLRPRPQHSEERVSDELGERPVFAFRGNVFLLGGRGGTEVPDEQEGGGRGKAKPFHSDDTHFTASSGPKRKRRKWPLSPPSPN